MKFLKNYASSLILLMTILIGGFLGVILGEKAIIFEPIGNLFLNLIFTLLVPIVFFSISSSIANMESSKKLGKILGTTIIVFAITAIISGIIGVISFKLFNPTNNLDSSIFNNLLNSTGSIEQENVGIIQKIVSSITVNDFSELLSRNNMLALILFSILIGFATMLSKEDGKPFAAFLQSGSVVTMKMMGLIMYIAPLGLGCYFATVVGQLGSQILGGYIKVFILYIVVSIIYFFGFFTIYAYIAGKKQGVKIF